MVFKDFLTTKKKSFIAIAPKDFDAFHYFLQKKGLKTNTRRRKLITARSLYRYALIRKKIPFSPAKFIRPPERLERLPKIPTKGEYQKLISMIPLRSSIALRNRILVQILGETGISVSELCALSWKNFSEKEVSILGKKTRKIKISSELKNMLKKWHKENRGKYIFPGFNRHGVTTEKMTPRGVEILFRQLAKKASLPKLMPKSLRHYIILEWLRQKIDEKEILRRLGVSSSYSLHAYKKLLES